MVRRGILEPIPESDLIYHNGVLLAAGAFGVGKGKQITLPSGASAESLRLIINLTTCTVLQKPIRADVKTLPHFGQWANLELMADEVWLWDSDDVRCCFYVFQLPKAWRPWFVLHKPVRGSVLGRSEPEVYLSCAVLPMGWLSAVGLCQYFMRQMLLRPPPAGAGLPP